MYALSGWRAILDLLEGLRVRSVRLITNAAALLSYLLVPVQRTSISDFYPGVNSARGGDSMANMMPERLHIYTKIYITCKAHISIIHIIFCSYLKSPVEAIARI